MHHYGKDVLKQGCHAYKHPSKLEAKNSCRRALKGLWYHEHWNLYQS